jgi:hypothetical protein
MTLSAVIDEAHIVLCQDDDAELEIVLAKISNILEKLIADRVLRLKRSTIYEAEVVPNVMLMDILFSSARSLDHDLRTQLIRQLDSISDWNSTDDPRSSEEFAIDKLKDREQIACIVFDQNAQILPGPPVLHRIGELRGLLKFYRDAIEIEDYDVDTYFAHASRAFPDLFFKPNIASECRRFSEPYRSIRPALTEAFAALGDLLTDIRRDNSDLRLAQKEFSVRSGFEISPESPNTHKNRSAMAERDIIISAKRLRCEWHLKLKPHVDRIHFHFGDKDIENGKIIIGILCAHLKI